MRLRSCNSVLGASDCVIADDLELGYLLNPGHLLHHVLAIKVLDNLLLMPVFLYESVGFVVGDKFLQLEIRLFLFFLTLLYILAQLFVRPPDLLDMFAIVMQFVVDCHLMELRQLSRKCFMEIVHHNLESVVERPIAYQILDVVYNIDDEGINFFTLIQVYRVRYVLGLVEQHKFILSLQSYSLEVFLERVWALHS